MMKYGIDLNRISVDDFKDILKKQNLLPSRRLLLNDIDENFSVMQGHGISTVSQLRRSLSSADKISRFSAESGIQEGYLAILKREAGSIEQKPVPIGSFPNMDPLAVSKLNDAGIKTSKDYFESRPVSDDELYCLCDLVRINGVGPVAAKAFYEAGYRSVPDVANADAATLLEKVSEINDVKKYYKAKLGVKDMQFCIDFSSLLLRLCE